MKLRNFVLVGALVLGTAGVANAGTGVTNQTIIRKTTNGYGEINFSGYETVVKHQENYSQSLKAESYGGTSNLSIAEFDGVNLTGYAESSNEVVVDPVAIITVSSQVETVDINSYSQYNGFETYDFTERSNTHNVNSIAF